MFGFRSDGVRVKDIDAETALVPILMKTRNDAMNFNVVELRCEPFDEFIKEKREKEGVCFSYMDILLAGAIRLYALRPHLNRFAVAGRVYQRNGLYVSFTVKKGLNDESPDATMKIRFTGRENIYEVKEILDRNIKHAMDEKNSTEKTANVFKFIPNCLVRFAVNILRGLDHLGIMPKKLIDVSPFHTSFYFTNLKSIHGDYIHHHLYNFGTTGMFYSIGKEKMEPVVDGDEIKIGKVLKMGMTTEERYCDGFYFVKSVRMFKKYMQNPHILEEELDIEPIESKKERKKRLKKIAKDEKKVLKMEKKAKKKELKRAKKEAKAA